MRYTNKRAHRILVSVLCAGGILFLLQRSWGQDVPPQSVDAIKAPEDRGQTTEDRGQKAEGTKDEGTSVPPAAGLGHEDEGRVSSGEAPLQSAQTLDKEQKGEGAETQPGVPPDGVPPAGVPPDGVPPDGVPPDGVPPDGGTAKETDAASKTVLKVEKTPEDLFSMELRNVEIQDLLRVLAYKYKLNIIMDQGVKGTVTASFSSIPLEAALDVLLENLNLISEREGTLIKIKPNLVSKTFTLHHVEAKLLYALLSGESAGSEKKSTLANLLSADGKVFMGSIPNSLLVIDYPSRLKSVEEYIAMVDQKMASRIFKLKYLNAADIVGTDPEKASGDAKTQ